MKIGRTVISAEEIEAKLGAFLAKERVELPQARRKTLQPGLRPPFQLGYEVWQQAAQQQRLVAVASGAAEHGEEAPRPPLPLAVRSGIAPPTHTGAGLLAVGDDGIASTVTSFDAFPAQPFPSVTSTR